LSVKNNPNDEISTELNVSENSTNLESIKSEGIKNAASQILDIVNELEESFTYD
jgi:hypothetical protein